MRLVQNLHTMALTSRLIEQEIKRQSSRRACCQIDGAGLFDRTRRGLVMKAFVEVVDHSQLFQRSPGAVDQLHLERHPIADLCRQGARHQHRNGVFRAHCRGQHRGQHEQDERQKTVREQQTNGGRQ